MSCLFLSRVLNGRESRARLQARLLESYPLVCQLSLNFPGYPKHVPKERMALEKTALLWLKMSGLRTEEWVLLDNGAGCALLMAFRVYAQSEKERAKRKAVEIEETFEWGRLFDIDLITREGPFERRSLELPQRKCLLCPNEAKFCARLRLHPYEALRREALRLWSRFPFSS